MVVALAGASHGAAASGIEDDYLPGEDGWRFMVSPHSLLASQSTAPTPISGPSEDRLMYESILLHAFSRKGGWD
jgi:hypothetical protein